MADHGADIQAEALVRDLAEAGSLRQFMSDTTVKAALVQELRDLGVPAPALCYRLIQAAVGRSETFLGAALLSRLQAFIDKTPPLADLLQRIANLHHGARAKDNLRAALVAAIRDGKPVDVAAIDVDDATSLDTVLALHSVQGFEQVFNRIDGQSKAITDGIRADLDNLFHDIVAPTLSWPDPATTPDRLRGFNRLKYTAGIDKLEGRGDQIDMLHRFVGDLSLGGKLFHFRWMLLTAEGGSGKTRLAFDFTREELDRRYWDAGKLDLNNLQTLSDPNKWRPRKPTFIVVDYARSAPDRIRDLLVGLSSNAKYYDVPVRLLLLERRADPDWVDRMVPDDGNRPMVMDHCHGSEGLAGRPLPPIPLDAVAAIMARRFALADKATPEPKALLTAVIAVDSNPIEATKDGDRTLIPAPRPLFALAVAEEWISGMEKGDLSADSVPRFDRNTVFGGIIGRERRHWRAAAADDADLQRHEYALALATLVQGLDTAVLNAKAGQFGAAARWLPDGPPDLNLALIGAMGGGDGYLPHLEPDILGEFYLLETLLRPGFGPTERTAFLTGAVTLNPPQPLVTLLRIFQDFPDRFSELELCDTIANCTVPDAARQFAMMAVDYVNICARRKDFDGAEAIIGAVAELQGRFNQDEYIALQEAKAAFNVTNHAGADRDWARIDAMFDRLDAVRGGYPDDAEIALREAKAAVNVTNHAGADRDWARVDAMFDRLDAVRGGYPDDAEIALQEAMAAVNVTSDAGADRDWARVDAMFDRLDAVRGGYPDHAEIALQEAMAAVNVTNHAGADRDWARVDAMFDRLDAVRGGYPDDAEIALQEAMAAVNVTSDAGADRDWARVDAMFDRLDAVRGGYPDDAEIALQEAMAAVNVTNHAGADRDWARVDAMFDRLDAVRGGYPDDAEIALQEAKAAFNVTSDAGADRDWARVDAMFDRFDAVRGGYPDHAEIALREAKAAFNVTSDAGADRGLGAR